MKKTICLLIMSALLLPMQAQSSHLDSIRMQLSFLTQAHYDSTLVLSLEDACNYAVAQNRSLQNASLEVKKAHAQRWQTIAAMLPQADGSLAYSNMCGYEMNLNGMKIQMPDYNMYSVTVSAGLNGQAIVGALLNNIAITMQNISLEQSEDELRANVINSYLSVLVTADVIQLLDSSLQNLRSLAMQTQRMVEVGAAESTEADKLLVQVNTFANTVQSYRRNLQLAYSALRALLNVSESTDLHLTTPLSDFVSTEYTMQLLMQEWDIHRNHNYRLLEQNVDLAKKNVIMAGMAYLPTVSAYYQYSYRQNFSEGGFNMTPPNMIGATVSMPLWSSGKRASAITEKKIALQEAENTFSETTDNLAVQYSQLRYNLANAFESYLTDKENVDVTKRVFNNTSNKYQWGAASALELTNASSDLNNAETTYVSSVMSMVNALVELEKFLNNN